jgi:hypothetical protein
MATRGDPGDQPPYPAHGGLNKRLGISLLTFPFQTFDLDGRLYRIFQSLFI